MFGLIALFVLGAVTAVTAWFPTMADILTVTLIRSIGFHYLETVNQSLQLQWIYKAEAPRVLGLLTAAGAGSALFAYGMILIATQVFDLSYNPIYVAGDGATRLIAILCSIGYPRFRAANVQTKKRCCAGAIGFIICSSLWPALGARFLWFLPVSCW